MQAEIWLAGLIWVTGLTVRVGKEGTGTAGTDGRRGRRRQGRVSSL